MKNNDILVNVSLYHGPYMMDVNSLLPVSFQVRYNKSKKNFVAGLYLVESFISAREKQFQ